MIERKKKICKSCGKETFLWSHGNCKSCWTKIYLKEKKVKDKPKQDLLEKWFVYQFEKFGGVCAETGRQLNYSRRVVMHLLPKKDGIGGYKYFATHPDNGLVAAWWVHDIVDKGSPAQRLALKCWATIREGRKKLLEECGMEYNEEFWLNMKT